MRDFQNKKTLLGTLFFIIGIFSAVVVSQAFQVRYTLTGTEVMRVDDAGGIVTASSMTIGTELTVASSITITSGDIGFGSVSASLSTAPTVGNSSGLYFSAFLFGSNSAAEGSVLVATDTVSGEGFTVAVATGQNHFNYVGIAQEATSTGSIVNVYTSGMVLVLTTGTVTSGDILISSGTGSGLANHHPGYSGRVLAGTAVDSREIIGIAIGDGDATGGLTKVRMR